VCKEPCYPIPALERLKGNSAKVVMRFFRNSRKSIPLDILMLSPVYGFVLANEKISFKEPVHGEWNEILLSPKEVLRNREENLLTFKKFLIRREYDEVYVNLGQKMLQLIEGFDKIVPLKTRIIYAKGKGIGPKMADMKEWLNKNFS
jgi:hypothetical protein